MDFYQKNYLLLADIQIIFVNNLFGLLFIYFQLTGVSIITLIGLLWDVFF